MSEDFTCSYEFISNSTDKCLFTQTYCEGTYFNLMSFHYCQLNNALYFSLPIYITFCLLCFYIVTDTSNKYLSSSLTIISEKLRLSPNLAAMTLLSLGNGAPDVITAIVASGDDEDGLSLSIGALFGCGIVLTTLVVSLVIIFSKNEIKIIPKMFVRETIFYLISLAIIGIIGITKKITLWEAILFISIYFINIIVAVIIEKTHKNKNKNNDIGEDKITSNESDTYLSNNEEKNEKAAEEIVAKINAEFSKVEADINISNENTISNSKIVINTADQTQTTLIEKPQRKKAKRNLFYRIKRHYFNTVENYKELSLIKKVFYILLDLPLNVLRDITIPAVEEKHFHRYIFCFFPFFGFLMCVTFINLWSSLIDNLLILILTISISLIISLILLYFLRNHQTLPNTILPFCFINFVLSIVWIWAACNIIVDVLQFIGIIFNINSAFLGLTFLAIGNCVRDASLNYSLAKSGYGEMAVAGSFAGPLFNLLIGLGVSLIKQVIMKGEIEFDFFASSNLPILTAYVTLILNLILILIICIIRKFKLSKLNAVISLIIFLGYIGCLSYVTFALG